MDFSMVCGTVMGCEGRTEDTSLALTPKGLQNGLDSAGLRSRLNNPT